MFAVCLRTDLLPTKNKRGGSDLCLYAYDYDHGEGRGECCMQTSMPFSSKLEPTLETARDRTCENEGGVARKVRRVFIIQ